MEGKERPSAKLSELETAALRRLEKLKRSGDLASFSRELAKTVGRFKTTLPDVAFGINIQPTTLLQWMKGENLPQGSVRSDSMEGAIMFLRDTK